MNPSVAFQGAPGGAPAVTLAGTRVGSYRLERRIGAGGMGEVWLGRHVVSNGLGAVKVLGPKLSGRADAVELFAREKRALLRLSHPHIVPVFEVGSHHIAMAYVDGASLARKLRAEMAPGEVFRIARQIASALAHAHARHVLHLDVKPSNVLLDTAGNAFLADFGAALLLDTERATEPPVFGTPSYIAPERSNGEACGEAADQFALGRTMVAALLGTERLPPWGREADALPASLPAAARAVVVRAVAVDPASRFPSLDAFEDALAACGDVTGVRATRPRLEPVRDDGPYAWASHPVSYEEMAPSIVRADYALDALDRDAALPAQALAAFRDKTGLATTGFSLYGHVSTLGARPDAGWLTRARSVVVLVAGYVTARECWTELALALVRDNPQAVVVTIDHSGFGDSSFASPQPALEHLGYAAVARMMLAWTELCGVASLPTVLVGHSMAATGLFLLPDDAFGPHRARIALTPMFTAVHPKAPSMFFLRLLLTLMALVALVPGAYRALMKLLDAIDGSTKDLTAARRRALLDESVHLPPALHARLVKSLLYAVPEGVQPLRRMFFAFGSTDEQATPEVVERVCGLLRVRPERFRWLASGAHFPHLESVTNPEGTLRNRHELVLLVDEARDEVSPERRESTEFAATEPASGEAPPAVDRDSTSTALH